MSNFVNETDTTQDVLKHRCQLKGLLALLPDKVSWYRNQKYESENNINQQQPTLKKLSHCTSRKQQRRQLKRANNTNEIMNRSVIDVENGGSIIDIVHDTIISKEDIYLSDILHDQDIVVILLFDPYQPYSIQILQQFITICQISETEKTVPPSKHGLQHKSTTTTTSTMDDDTNVLLSNELSNNHDNNKNHDTSRNVDIENISLYVSDHTNIIDDDRKTATAMNDTTVQSDRSPKLHCLVTTPCHDNIFIDTLLQNTGIMLLPWDSEPSLWKVVMNVHVCPTILGVIECQYGKPLFPIRQEEVLALEWNTPSHIQQSWLYHRCSAVSSLQRMKAFTLYPTSTICTIH